MLSNTERLIASLKGYDKDNVPKSILQKVKPVVTHESFTPENMMKKSAAIASLCVWAMGMYEYATVKSMI